MQPLTPDHVRTVIESANLGLHVQEFTESTATSELAAAAIGCEVGQIAKSICMIVNGNPILVVASGDQQVDDRKIATMFEVGRKKVKLAKVVQHDDKTYHLKVDKDAARQRGLLNLLFSKSMSSTSMINNFPLSY